MAVRLEGLLGMTDEDFTAMVGGNVLPFPQKLDERNERNKRINPHPQEETKDDDSKAQPE